MIVAAVPVLPTWQEMLVFPSLAALMLGRWRNMPAVTGSLHYHSAVSSENVLEVLQPGHPEYDSHPLPR